MKKNKLNEQEEEKVSGGYYHFSDDGTFERTENNKRYDLYCDFCNKKMEGRGAFKLKNMKQHICIDCFKKLKEINPSICKDKNYSLNSDDVFGNKFKR